MSGLYVHAVKHLPRGLVTSGERNVLFILADEASDDGDVSGRARDDLAAAADVSPRRWQEILATLREKGLVETEAHQVGGRRHGTHYTLALTGCGVPHPDRVRGSAPIRGRAILAVNDKSLDTASSPDGDKAGPAPPAPRETTHSDLFGAICDACDIAAADLPSSSRARIGKVARELREVGATPARVAAAAENWSTLYREATLTPEALLKHWSQLVGKLAELPREHEEAF